MLPVDNWTGGKVSKGPALKTRQEACGKGFYFGVQARFQKEGDGKAGGFSPRAANAVGSGHEIVCSPGFQHVTQIDDQAILPWWGRDPAAVRASHFETSYFILGENGQTAEIGVLSDPLPGNGVPSDWRIGDQPKHAVGWIKVTGKGFVRQGQAGGKAAHDLLSHRT